MNDRVGSLLLELLDLARGQRVALGEGDIDAAVELIEKRQGILAQIQKSGRVKRVPLFSCAWDDGDAPMQEVFWESRHPVIEQILSIDDAIRKDVMTGMSEVASSLDNIEKLRILMKSSDLHGKGDKARVIV